MSDPKKYPTFQKLLKQLDVLLARGFSLLKNRFVLATLVFVIWMLMADEYNLFYKTKIWSKLQDKRAKKEYLQEEIERVRQDLHDLFSDEKSIEKFAREKYFMKRDDEDIFVIEKQK